MLLKNAMKTPIPDVWLRTRELGRPAEISIVLLQQHRAYVRAALTKGHCRTETALGSPHRAQAPTLGSTFYLPRPAQDLERNSAPALKFCPSETTKAPSVHGEGAVRASSKRAGSRKTALPARVVARCAKLRTIWAVWMLRVMGQSVSCSSQETNT